MQPAVLRKGQKNRQIAFAGAAGEMTHSCETTENCYRVEKDEWTVLWW